MNKIITKEQYDALSDTDKDQYYPETIHINDESYNWETKDNLIAFKTGDLNKIVLPTCAEKHIYVKR